MEFQILLIPYFSVTPEFSDLEHDFNFQKKKKKKKLIQILLIYYFICHHLISQFVT